MESKECSAEKEAKLLADLCYNHIIQFLETFECARVFTLLNCPVADEGLGMFIRHLVSGISDEVRK